MVWCQTMFFDRRRNCGWVKFEAWLNRCPGLWPRSTQITPTSFDDVTQSVETKAEVMVDEMPGEGVGRLQSQGLCVMPDPVG